MGFMEKATKIRAAVSLITMLLIGCLVCLLGEQSYVRSSQTGSGSAGNVAEQLDLSKLRVQDEEGRSGLPVIVLDKDGNVIGTHGGKELEKVELNFYNQIVNGELSTNSPPWEYHIESGAFSACPNMKRLVVANDNVTYIADDAFRGCRSDLVIYCAKDTYVWKRIQEMGLKRQELPYNAYHSYGLTSEKRAKKLQELMEQKGLGAFTREELREREGDPFFYMVEGGALVAAGGSVHVETMCFDTGLEYPSEARKIDSNVFMHLAEMEGINIPPYIEEIADFAFMDTVLKKVEFELDGGKSQLKRIGVNAFMQADFSNSPKLVIPEGVTEIGQNAFYICEGLEEIVLPKSLKVIGDSCFYGCNKLKKVTILSPDVQYKKKSENAGASGVFGLCGTEYIDKTGEFTKSKTVIKAPEGSTTEAYVKEHATEDELQEGLRFESIED